MSILVATDLSEHSRSAIRWASALAASRQTHLYVVHVIDSLGDEELWTALFETPEEIERRVLTSATKNVSDFATETLRGHPSPDERSILVAVGPPAEEIARFADLKDVDLVVSGTTGHGRLRNAVFGSTAHRLTHDEDRPTVFVPVDSEPPPAKRIVVALDFSDCSRAALSWVADVATEWDADVTAVHGVGVSALSPDYEPAANFVPMVDAIVAERTDRVERMLRDYGVEGEVVISRASPAEAILEVAADKSADLIAMGTHGRGPVKRMLLGSVALRVLRDAPCAITTIHQ